MYQQIQAINTEEKTLEILEFSKMWIVQKGRNFNEFQTALSDMNMQNQFNKMSVLNVKKLSENIHKPKQEEFNDFLYKFMDIQRTWIVVLKLKNFQGHSSFVRTPSYKNKVSKRKHNGVGWFFWHKYLFRAYLFIKDVTFTVNNDRRINEVFHPVGSTFHIQRQIPIGPSCDPVLKIL
jgi:hypothetical protein